MRTVEGKLMAFPEWVRQRARERAGGQCECKRKICGHSGRCPKRLRAPYWNAHHRVAVKSGGPDTLSNCEALCRTCHKNTRTYGQN